MADGGLCAALAIPAFAGPAGAATAPGQVFAPNPVADLGIQTLTDQKDADYFEACVADWDSVSYTRTEPHCLRRVDGDKHYPEDLADPREVHRDGEIWSRALWDIRNALGARLADTIIIRAQFGFSPDTSMPDAAAVTIATAGLYGRSAQKAVRAAFAARGLA